MKADRRRQVIVESSWTEPEHGDQFFQETDVSLREIVIARICPANMRAKRAACACRIALVSELILGNAGIHSGNRCLLNRYQRIARLRPADHFRSKRSSFRQIASGPLVKKLPELSHILFQLPHNKIGSVTAEIFFCWEINRLR